MSRCPQVKQAKKSKIQMCQNMLKCPQLKHINILKHAKNPQVKHVKMSKNKTCQQVKYVKISTSALCQNLHK